MDSFPNDSKTIGRFLRTTFAKSPSTPQRTAQRAKGQSKLSPVDLQDAKNRSAPQKSLSRSARLAPHGGSSLSLVWNVFARGRRFEEVFAWPNKSKTRSSEPLAFRPAVIVRNTAELKDLSIVSWTGDIR